jgi:hypothetical protein
MCQIAQEAAKAGLAAGIFCRMPCLRLKRTSEAMHGLTAHFKPAVEAAMGEIACSISAPGKRCPRL